MAKKQFSQQFKFFFLSFSQSLFINNLQFLYSSGKTKLPMKWFWGRWANVTMTTVCNERDGYCVDPSCYYAMVDVGSNKKLPNALALEAHRYGLI